MELIKENFNYREDCDILVRVYDNQDIDNQDEKRQIASEVLFRPYLNIEHKHATSLLPRGAVNFIVQELNKLGTNSYKVQISNELPDNVGVLTHCRENFDNSLEWDKLNI